MKIPISEKQSEFLSQMTEQWEQNGVIDSGTKAKLLDSVESLPFDWKRLAKYSFWISIICVFISLQAVLADKWIIKAIEALFTSSNIGLCILFAGIAAVFYYWAFVRKGISPQKIYSNDFILTFGIIFTAASIAYFGKYMDTGDKHYSLLFILATVIYGFIGLFYSSKLVWVFSILSFGSWFGTETGYISEWDSYYLGMNYPLRFVFFGSIITGISFLFSRFNFLKDFQKTTYQLGLLYLFIALWIVSIVGNTATIQQWQDASHLSLLGWGIGFALAAFAAMVYGLKYHDYTSRSFGITFLIINLYTQYFLYCWKLTHKAIFFLILGVTFWFIGKNVEKIWNLTFLQKKQD